MTKEDYKPYLELMSGQGYHTHSLMLELFKDDEEIPEFMDELICHPIQETKPFEIHCGRQAFEEFKKLGLL